MILASNPRANHSGRERATGHTTGHSPCDRAHPHTKSGWPGLSVGAELGRPVTEQPMLPSPVLFHN